jgi:Flp pilus assembly protein TadB
VSTEGEYPAPPPPPSPSSIENEESKKDKVSAMTQTTVNLYILSIVLIVITIPLALVLGTVIMVGLAALDCVFGGMFLLKAIPMAKRHEIEYSSSDIDLSSYTDNERLGSRTYHYGPTLHMSSKSDAGDFGILAGTLILLFIAVMAASALLWQGIPIEYAASGLVLIISGVTSLAGGINYKILKRRYLQTRFENISS